MPGHLRRATVEASIPCGVSLGATRALVETLRAGDEALAPAVRGVSGGWVEAPTK